MVHHPLDHPVLAVGRATLIDAGCVWGGTVVDRADGGGDGGLGELGVGPGGFCVGVLGAEIGGAGEEGFVDSGCFQLGKVSLLATA